MIEINHLLVHTCTGARDEACPGKYVISEETEKTSVRVIYCLLLLSLIPYFPCTGENMNLEERLVDGNTDILGSRLSLGCRLSQFKIQMIVADLVDPSWIHLHYFSMKCLLVIQCIFITTFSIIFI